jgi:hypothetical protein
MATLDADLSQIAGGPSAAGGGSLTSYIWNSIKYVAYLTNDGHVHELRLDGQNWKDADLSQLAVDLSNAAAKINNVWISADLSQLTGAPPAIGVNTLTSYIWNNYKQAAYLTNGGHIHELTFAPVPVPPAGSQQQPGGCWVSVPIRNPDGSMSSNTLWESPCPYN